MVVLLFERASLEANHQAALAQAQNVSKELQRRLDESGKKDDDKVKKEEKRRGRDIVFVLLEIYRDDGRREGEILVEDHRTRER